MLATGIQGEKKEQVTQENTALTMKSGALKVYATPAMIALMEQAAYTSVAGELEEGQGTVGTLMNVSHISATPVGMEVTAKSELLKVDGRKQCFILSIRLDLPERLFKTKEKQRQADGF